MIRKRVSDFAQWGWRRLRIQKRILARTAAHAQHSVLKLCIGDGNVQRLAQPASHCRSLPM